MLRQKQLKRGSTSSPQARKKKEKGEIQTRTQNLNWIENQEDAVLEKDLLEEETTLQEEVEET